VAGLDGHASRLKGLDFLVGHPPEEVNMSISRMLEEHRMPEVYVESGDHEHLLKIAGARFADLMRAAEVVDVGRHI
jgi:Ala-tRNA(Pro) deacylase